MQKSSKRDKERKTINEINSLVLWSNLGLIFLLAALSCLLCKYAQAFWPLFLVSILGLIATFYWDIKGFLLGFGVITAVLAKLHVSNGFELWDAFFAISSILSWLLLLLGRQEISTYFKNRTLKEQGLKEQCTLLQKKIEQIQERTFVESLQKKQQEILCLKKQLKELNDQLCLEKKEKSIWHKRHYKIIQKFSECQSREKDFQKILEKMRLHQMETKKNFHEKTLLLDEARKRMFYLENTLLTLEKECIEKESELDPQVCDCMTHIIQMQEAQQELESEIHLLEEVICSICKPQKKVTTQKNNPELIKRVIPQYFYEKKSIN